MAVAPRGQDTCCFGLGPGAWKLIPRAGLSFVENPAKSTVGSTGIGHAHGLLGYAVAGWPEGHVLGCQGFLSAPSGVML